MSEKLMIVIGSGPGIGVATASHFASQGFNVALLARNAERLEKDAATVRKAVSSGSSIKVQTYSVDVVDHVGLKKTLDQVKSEMGSPEVIHYNAARVAESKIGEEDPEMVIQDFKIINIGCYVAATWALPVLASVAQQNSEAHPTFLITGGRLWEIPMPTHFSLSMQKAAQVNFAGSLSQTAAPKGIHVATIAIAGAVQDSDPVMNAKNIAKTFWELSREDKEHWQSIVNIGEP